MRVSYEAISLYSPNRAPCAVDLGDNTNLWGLPPAVRRLMEGATDQVITRYPQAYADDLKRAIAEYVQLPVECVVTGCGSDDVLDSAHAGKLLARGGEKVIQRRGERGMGLGKISGLRQRALVGHIRSSGLNLRQLQAIA